MPTFDEIFNELDLRTPHAPLFPTQKWKPELSRAILDSSDTELFPNGAPAEIGACRAGLLLWNDDLDASHELSQGLHNVTGSFWHAIMHRREGDASNSRYWWHKTGSHPAFAELYAAVRSDLETETHPDALSFAAHLRRAKTWEPVDFVACGERVQLSGKDDTWLRRIQHLEIATLLRWCAAT
ncbi:MAG TPA: hypothetical protein VF719_05380 [Abditibacteriaceae bacterium]|jgi:hypothetical protein